MPGDPEGSSLSNDEEGPQQRCQLPISYRSMVRS